MNIDSLQESKIRAKSLMRQIARKLFKSALVKREEVI
jgi:hypothetical protein